MSFASTVGVWRVRCGDRARILKHLRLGAAPTEAWGSELEIDSPFYWRREVEVYASNLLDGGPVRAPECTVFERADGSVALWLEDVGDPEPWPLEDIAEVASKLASLRAPRITLPWLTHGWLPWYLELRAGRVDPALGVWRRREEILERIGAGPPVLVHNDFHPGNIFRPGGVPVVIDWAFCGIGVPGEDAGVLAAELLFDGFFPIEEAEDLIAHVWSAYSAALDPGLVREAEFVYFAGNALRYAWAAEWNERFSVVYRALAAAADARGI